MATNFPTSLDNLSNPAGSDPVNNPSHAVQHANVNDAIEALEAKVGANSSTVTTSHDYKITQLEAAITAGLAGAKSIYQDVRNQSGSSLAKATPVYVTGSEGASGKLLVAAASNAVEYTSSKTMGLTSSTIANNTNGQVITEGIIENVDTTGAVDGAPVWLGTNGAKIYGLVNKPAAPAHLVFLGIVVRGGQAQTGSIYVKIQNGFEMEELHNVQITSPATGEVLVYDATTSLWKNSNTIASKTYVDNAITSLGNTAANTYVPVSDVGNPDGVASLDSSGLIPDSQIPAGIARDSEVSSAISTAVNNLINSAPGTLDTLGEIATQLAADESAVGALTTVVNGKVSKAGGDVITSSLPSVVGLTVKGAASQSANLQEWKNSSGTTTSYIDVNGSFVGNGNLVFNAQGVVGFYTILSSQFGVVSQSASRVGEIIKGASSQTANLTEWQNSSGAILARVTSAGVIGTTGNIYSGRYYFSNNGSDTGTSISFIDGSAGGGLKVRNIDLGTPNAGFDNIVPLTISGNINQTANLQEWRNGSGTLLAAISSSGGTTWLGGYNIFGGDTRFGTNLYFDAETSLAPRVAGEKGLVIRGVTSQTANLQEWQLNSGTVAASISAYGDLIIPGSRVAIGSSSLGGATMLYSVAANAGYVPIVAQAAGSQTADLQQWKNSSGTNLTTITSSGSIFTTSNVELQGVLGVGGFGSGSYQILDSITSASRVGLAIKGAASQSANLQEWQNSGGTVLAKVDSTGAMFTPTAASGTNTTQVATTAFVKTAIDSSVQPGALYQTSAPTSPAVGQIWIDSDDDVTTFDSNIIRRKAFTATAGQTVFVTDLPFIDGFEQVYMNGLLLVKTTDYTVSGGNTVTLTSGAAVSDIIEVVTVTGANSVTTYTQAEVDALIANNKAVSPQSISANTTLAKKKRYYVTSASALTLTLPASPTLDDEIQIVDASGNASTYNITVARNGSLINGNAGNLIIDNNGGWYTLIYTGSTYGWKVG